MAVIELEQFRRKLAADQGFRTWLARFREEFGPQTRLRDLSDQTLLFLATPGDDHLYVIFDLVMGVRGWGTSTRFILDDLPTSIKQQILDVALRLLDFCRFEVLRRLDWVEGLPELELPLVVLVERLSTAPVGQPTPAPVLRTDHPDYPAYQQEVSSERPIFIRRLIPGALAAFRQRLEAAQPESS